MPLYTALTVGSLMRELAQSLGDLIFDGTSDSGSTTTLVDAPLANLFLTNDDEAVKGAWLYGISGTAAAQEKLVSAYTASSGTLTWTGAATSPAGDTGYILTRQHRPTEYLRALQEAQRYQAQRGLSLLPVIGREGIVGNLIPNGGFDLWTTADTPDGGFTIQGVDTMETTITAGPRRAYKLVSDGTLAAFIRFAIPQWGKFRGQTVRCYALARSSIAARTSLQFADGVLTTTDTVTTNSVWELLEVSAAFSDAATQAQVSIEVSSGSAVTLYVQFLYVPDPDLAYEQAAIDADRALVWIGGLKVSKGSVLSSNGRGYAFGIPLRLQNFDVVEDTEDTPRLLRLDVAGSYRGHVLEYEGWKIHPEFTGPTVSYAGTPELILPRARAIMLRNAAADPGEVAAAEASAAAAEAALGVHVNINTMKRVMAQ